MMADPRFFQNIRIPLPVKSIHRRLGFVKKHNTSGSEELSRIRAVMENALDCIVLRGSLVRLSVSVSGQFISLEGGITLESRQTAKLLDGCQEALLMGVTGGSEIIRKIERLTEAGELRKAVIYDAAASEIVDAGLDWMRNYIRREILRESGRIIKHRFSAGYGDLVLENQKLFYDVLGLEKLGVKITEGYILVPEKSVTAITGLQFGE